MKTRGTQDRALQARIVRLGVLVATLIGCLLNASSVDAACSCQGAVFISKISQRQIVRVCRNPDGTYTEEPLVDDVDAGALTFGPDNALYAVISSDIRRYDPNTGASLGTFVSGVSLVEDMQFGPDGNLYLLVQTYPDLFWNCPRESCGSVRRYDSQGTLLSSFDLPNFPGRMSFGPNGSLYITTGVSSAADPLAIQNRWSLGEYDPETGALLQTCLGAAVFGQTGASGFCLHAASAQPEMFNCNPYAVEAMDSTHLYVGDDCGVVHVVAVAPDGTCAVQPPALHDFQQCGGVYCAGFVVVRWYPRALKLGLHPPFEGVFLHADNDRPASSSGTDCTTPLTNGSIDVDILNLDTSELARGLGIDDYSLLTNWRPSRIALQPSVACDDGDPCTVETCDLSLECHHTPVDCDDGNPCTEDSCNPATGGCTHQAVVCRASDQCHDAGTCSLPDGCSNPVKSDGTACNDGNGCTVNDACQTGTCAGGPAATDCDPAASAGSLVGGSSQLCDGGTVDTENNCVLEAGGVTLKIPLGGPPYAVDPPKNISIVNHTADSACPAFFSLNGSGQQVSCTEFLPDDLAFNGGKAATMTFGWSNTGRVPQPTCEVDTPSGPVLEGYLALFRNGMPLYERSQSGLPVEHRCDALNDCPEAPVTAVCYDQSLCFTQTCDPVSNTFTLVAKHFSEYALASLNHPPDCSAAVATPDRLWPPNHKYAKVGIGGVTDPDDDPVTITIDGITQDEPLDSYGDGHTCPDGAGVGTGIALVRAERAMSRRNSRDGRVYHIAFTAEDGRGGACSGTVSVCVPPHRRAGATCVDEGPLFDATGPCE